MMSCLVDWVFQQLSGVAFIEKLPERLVNLSESVGITLLRVVLQDLAKKILTKLQKGASKKALEKACKQFPDLIKKELEAKRYSKTEIKQYNRSLKKFIGNKEIKQWLAKAFAVNCQSLDYPILRETWTNLSLKPLPNDFDWKRISKLYLQRVKDIIDESPELKESKRLEESAQNIQNLSGIIPDYDLERYRESIIESYGGLKLSKLDYTLYSKGYQVNLLQIFVPQTVKEVLPPSRYDLPKEVLDKLREEKAIENNFFESSFEQYQQLWRKEKSKSVLDVVNDENSPYIVFLGDPGSGKSSLLKYLALDWSENPTERIPLLIELLDYIKDSNRPKNFLDYFHQGKRKICELNQNKLDEQLNTAELILPVGSKK